MKTTDFTTPINSVKLKENMNKFFGVNVKFETYSREQLEDMRNKIRTRIFQQENAVGMNDLLTNETYQKDKAMLALLNTRIKEMLGEDIAKLRDKLAQLDEAKKGVRAPKHTKKTKGSEDGNLANNYPPYDKVTRGDVIAGATGKDQKGGKAMEAAGEDDKGRLPAKKKETTWTDKSGKTHSSTKVQGHASRKADKEADKEKGLEEASDRLPAKKTDTTWTDKSGKKHSSTKVQGHASRKADKEADKEKKASAKDLGETKAENCNHTPKGKKCPVHGLKECGTMESSKKTSKLKESNLAFKHAVRLVNEGLMRFLAEDEEGKAKAITAAGDMVNDYTSWMQRVGQYQTKSMIELADAIRADFGTAEAEAFKQAVGPALSATLEVLTQQREAISNAVATLAGEMPMGAEPMGAEPAMAPEEPGMEPASPDMMNEPAGDEFGASDAAAGAGTSGREMRESKFNQKLAESHSIMSKLAR